MGRFYSVIFENVSVTVAQDLFELTPADDKPIIIHSIELAQISDVGDAQEEMLRLEIVRGHTTSGSGGSAPTPVPLDPSGSAAGCAAEVNNTTIASAGTTTVPYATAFNIRTGWLYVPAPECRIKASQANTTIVLRLMAAPADAITLSGTLVFEEM